MNASWNVFNLERPPYATWRIKPSDARAIDLNVNVLKSVINTAIRDLGSLDVLHREAAVLSRLIYRMKSKFRNDKGLKKMSQLNKALLNYYNMSLLNEYETLRPIVQMDGGMYTLPSKQMLQYVLVRIQGFAQLMIRMDKVAKDAAHFLKARIALGHAWSIALMAYATVSRIWVYVKVMLQKCCKWYKELHGCSENFQHVGLPWILKNQSLPHDLKLWLSDFDWIDNEINISDDAIWQKKGMFKLLKPQSDDTEEISLIVHDNLETVSRLSQEDILTHNISKNEPRSHADIDDVGEVISRDTFEKNLSKASHNVGSSSTKKHKGIMEESKNKRKKRETIRIKLKKKKSK